MHPSHRYRIGAIATLVAAMAPTPSGTTSVTADAPATRTTAHVVTFADTASDTDRAGALDDLIAAGAVIEQTFDRVLDGVAITVDPAHADAVDGTLARLARRSTIDGVEAERTVTVTAMPTTTRTGTSWGLDRIDQATGLDGTFTPAGDGAGVRVYVLDSGIAPHPDLAGRLAPGINLMDDQSPTDATDGNGHGTHIAGIAAGTTFGVAGAATVIPVRVLDDAGRGTTTGVIAGLDWVLATHPAGTPGIVNLSLDAGPSQAIDDAVNAALDAGLLVVGAAGNNAVDACTISPARVPRMITVGAASHDRRTGIDRRAEFSNHGPCLDVFAPGSMITSAGIDGGTTMLSGTSIAAPHVTGAAAALWGADRSQTAATVTARLLASVSTGVVNDAGRGSPADMVRLDPQSSPAPRSQPTMSRADEPGSLPARIVDTRSGIGGVPIGRIGSLDGAAAPLAVTVLGRAGVATSGVAAVALNITVTDTLADAHGGYLSAYPCTANDSSDRSRNVSTLNFVAGRTVANAAIVPVGGDGRVCIAVRGSANVIVDLTGALPVGTGFVPTAPTRVIDTRTGTGGIPIGRLDDTTTLRVPMNGRAGLPGNGLTAVSLNITATTTDAPATGGYITTHPCGTTPPNVSTLNFTTGQTVANAAIVPVGTDGAICVTVHGRTDIIIDLNGGFVTPSTFVATAPTRVIDTRTGTGGIPIGRLDDTTTLRVPMNGRAGLPTSGLTAVSLNITATTTVAPTTGGYITAFPCGTTPPNVSTLNFTTGQTIANAAIVPVDADGAICVTVHGRTDIIIDLNGGFTTTVTAG
jgi:subtilisin family serine protease